MDASNYFFYNRTSKSSISLSDFSFKLAGYGHYSVTYTSPVTGKQWTSTVNDMPLIDATKNAESPKIKELNELKSICKA